MKRVKIHSIEQVYCVEFQKGVQHRFCQELLDELSETLTQLQQDPLCKAVVVQGEGNKCFSAGLDIDWVGTQSLHSMQSFLKSLHLFLKQTLEFSKPLVAALNGHTFGLGAIWACCFDFRLMNQDKGWICFPEVEIPFEVPQSILAPLDLVLTPQQQTHLILQAKRLTAQEGYSFGLIDQISSLETLQEKAVVLAKQCASKNPINYQRAKERIRKQAIQQLEFTSLLEFSLESWLHHFQK